MNTLHRTKRSAARTPHRARKAAAALGPLALLAALLTPTAPASAETNTQPAPQSADQSAGEPVAADATTDAAGNVIPPVLNRHVDQWCDTSSGTSGSRVQFLLVEEPGDLTSTTRERMKAQLREEARYIDDVLAVASAETGGDNMGKRVRWVHDAGTCTVSVRSLTLAAGTMGASAGGLKTAIQNQYPGLIAASNRIYLAVTAKPITAPGNMPSCGQATMASNRLYNDGRESQFARIGGDDGTGQPCYTVNPRTYDSSTLHEFIHTLGAFYGDAPGSMNGSAECNDGYDALCGPQMNTTPKCEGMWVFDCGKDSYFNTRPVDGPYPSPYLANPANWNTANSPYFANTTQLPAPPPATITFNKTAPAGNDVVTATVQTKPGARVEWATSDCDYTGAPKTATADINGRATYTIQCYDAATATVSARVSEMSGGTVVNAVARPKANVTYTSGPYANTTITGPTTVAPGQQVTLTAVTDAPGTWNYQWFAGQSGCGLPVWDENATGTPGKSVTFSCDGSLSDVVFFAEAVRTQDGRPADPGPHYMTVTTTAPPTGSLDIRTSGSMMAVGGNTFTIAATNWTNNATITGWSWSASNGCTATPLPNDRSIAEVTCPSATNAQVTFAVTATAADGRTGTGVHTVTVSPGTPPPPPPPPVPPTPPTAPKGTATELTAAASGASTVFTVTAKAKTGAALAGQRVAVETRPSAGGAYATAAWVTIGANGTGSVTLPATNPVFARAQFPGDTAWAPSVSREVPVSAMVVVKAAKWGSKGITATVKTTGGTAAAKVVLAVQKKVGSKWKKVASATTDAKGVAQIKMKVKAKTVFRLVSSASGAYRTDTSPNVTLKP